MSLLKWYVPVIPFPVLRYLTDKFEKGENLFHGTDLPGKRVRKNGTVKAITTRVVLVNAMLPPMPKTFDEIQGQVTADYQNYLDQQWIETLRKKYPVVVNQDVLQHVK